MASVPPPGLGHSRGVWPCVTAPGWPSERGVAQPGDIGTEGVPKSPLGDSGTDGVPSSPLGDSGTDGVPRSQGGDSGTEGVPKSRLGDIGAESVPKSQVGDIGTDGVPKSPLALPGGRGARSRLRLPWGHRDRGVPKGEWRCHPEPPSGLGLLVALRGPRVTDGDFWGCPLSPNPSRTVGPDPGEFWDCPSSPNPRRTLGPDLGALSPLGDTPGRIWVSPKEPPVPCPSPSDTSLSPGVTLRPGGEVTATLGTLSLGGLRGIGRESGKREEDEDEGEEDEDEDDEDEDEDEEGQRSRAATARRRLLLRGVTWRSPRR